MSAVYETVIACRVCGGKLDPVLSLGDQYLVRFPDKIDEQLPRAPLDLKQCESCGLLQLGHTVHPDLLFREFYYRSGINKTMREALHDVVGDVLDHHVGQVWLDIGANDGYLLNCVPSQWEAIACEPALNFRDELMQKADYVISDYFSANEERLTDRGRGRCDVITSIACFYDVHDPNRFVADVAKVLSPGGVWVNQLNDSPTMLRENAFDAICHEHLAYYDIPSLAKLYKKHGLNITRFSFNDINGGSVRIFAQKEVAATRPASLIGVPCPNPTKVQGFARRAKRWREEMGNLIQSIRGPLWGYGASTKGSVLLQYLGMADRFTAIADRNPEKDGKLMVGSWIPIVSEAVMREAKPSHALVLPWAFRKEFIERETEARDNGMAFLFPLPNIEVVL